LVKNDTYEFIDISSIKDLCIFIDDISISDTHQRVIEKFLQNCKIKTNSIFLYFAKLNNLEICYAYENELNYSCTTDVLKLTDLILSDIYKITIRTTKYLLSLPTKYLKYLVDKIIQQKIYNYKRLVRIVVSA
jgi:hypothetical protein